MYVFESVKTLQVNFRKLYVMRILSIIFVMFLQISIFTCTGSSFSDAIYYNSSLMIRFFGFLYSLLRTKIYIKMCSTDKLHAHCSHTVLVGLQR